MTTTGKVILGIIVVLIIAGGAYWYMTMHKASSAAMTASSTAMTNTASMTGSAAVANNPLPSGSSTSDASLNQDTAAIDAQMNGLDTDNAATAASVATQPASGQ